MKKKFEKVYIDSEIRQYYKIEKCSILAKRLGLSEVNLRVRASRLKIQRDPKVQIIDGYKLCSCCGKNKSITEFRKDRYQQTRLDYYCKSCRKQPLPQAKKIKNNGRGEQKKSCAFGVTKKRNPLIIIDSIEHLKCKVCNKILQTNNFYRASGNLSGYKNICKTCIKSKNTTQKNTL